MCTQHSCPLGPALRRLELGGREDSGWRVPCLALCTEPARHPGLCQGLVCCLCGESWARDETAVKKCLQGVQSCGMGVKEIEVPLAVFSLAGGFFRLTTILMMFFPCSFFVQLFYGLNYLMRPKSPFSYANWGVNWPVMGRDAFLVAKKAHVFKSRTVTTQCQSFSVWLAPVSLW